MNSNKNEMSQNVVKLNEVNEEKLSSAPNGTNATIPSDLEKNATLESPKPPEEQVENQPTDQDSPLSSTNLVQPEVLKSQSCEEEQCSVARPSEAVQTELPSTRKHTGPRTAQGKRLSKLNARKHGLFFKEVVVQKEKRSEYISLLNGLLDYWQPQGIMESIQVQNLAVLLWRLHRFFQAERAKISENMAFIVFNSIVNKYGEIPEGDGSLSDELHKCISNPVNITEMKEKLVQVRGLLTTEGFPWDFRLIEKLFVGDEKNVITNSFRALFEACGAEARQAAKTGEALNDAIFRKIMIASLDNKIGCLTEIEKRLTTMEVEKMKYKLSAAVIPSQEVMDLLMRYETHISREIDRILNRLERLQRMRKGQPLPPQLDVKIS
jgi:hypothetical protein